MDTIATVGAAISLFRYGTCTESTDKVPQYVKYGPMYLIAAPKAAIVARFHQPIA